jgi:hypothetical protein
VDATQLIQKDHRDVERLFEDFERAERAGDPARGAEIVRALVRELSVHASIEEQLVYPILRRAGADGRVLDALEEHHAAKVTLLELEGLPPGSPRLGSKMRVLAANVRRHVEEEERELLPLLERHLDDARRRELASRMGRARRVVPTRPHPAAPDAPPANLVVSAVAALWDRGRDALRGGARLLAALLAHGAAQGVGAMRELAERARDGGRETMARAVGRGREAAGGAARIGRQAVEQARERAARVEVRREAAARDLRRARANVASAAGEISSGRRKRRRARR